MKRMATFLILAVLLAKGAGAAGAQDYCSKPVRVAMFEFGILYRGGSGEGVDSRLLDVLSQRSGCVFERVVMPRARIWAELQAGSLDMATAAIPTPERKAFAYLMPYLTTRNIVLVRKSVGAVPESMAAFEGSNLRVGMVRGFKHEPAYDTWLGRLATQGRVTEVADVAELFKYLERGMVDAVVSQPIVFREYLDAERIQREMVQRDWAPPEQFSVGSLVFSRKSFTAEQAARWEALVVGILKDQTMLKIMQDFMPLDQARGIVYRGPRMPD
ncbi:transporter substrate-binding domain-containing protein [Rhodoferax sp. AJA081-3]|uniref:substrate-binding periplasmic protein n=1 Tax=Rhodoferax sp. AJA081-3 TaxID=2752316 RepID=UPI001AE09189|nr:transporter substrate-binding domain-containing protein [Rhodoferax sp. AJA081-3]QTN26566.1 transporter substrate-binding domain-containing protein [Rhodoferax sp. AJA081-3]